MAESSVALRAHKRVAEDKRREDEQDASALARELDRDCHIPARLRECAMRNDIAEVLRLTDELSGKVRSTVRDAAGRTLLHLACLAPTTEILAELLNEGKRNLPLQVVDYQGNHPMHVAAAQGNTEQVRVLEQRGVPLWTLNGRGQTPADVAEEVGLDFIARTLRDRDGGSAEYREEAIANWSQRVQLLESSSECQLMWREVELIAHLSIAVPLTPLPWGDVDLNRICERAQWTVVTTIPKLVAGMLLVDGDYCFEGQYFKLALEVESPHGTGTAVKTYESMSPPRIFVEVIVAKMPAPVAVVRVTAPRNATRQLAEVLHESRDVEDFEHDFFLRAGPTVRSALLSQSLATLGTAAGRIRRQFRQHRSLVQFREVIERTVRCIGVSKLFFKRTLVAKRLAIVGLCGSMKKFEIYCRKELERIDTTVYPFMLASLVTANSGRRTLAVREAISHEKVESAMAMRKYLAAVAEQQQQLPSLRLGAPPPPAPTASGPQSRPEPFRYTIPLDVIFPHFVRHLHVDKLVQFLLSRRSYLPRSTILALQRGTSSMSATELARGRMLSVLTDMYKHYVEHTSWAQERLDRMHSDDALREFLREEGARKFRETQQNRAAIASFIHRLSEQPTKRTREQKREQAEARRQDSMPRIMSIRDVVPPSAAVALEGVPVLTSPQVDPQERSMWDDVAEESPAAVAPPGAADGQMASPAPSSATLRSATSRRVQVLTPAPPSGGKSSATLGGGRSSDGGSSAAPVSSQRVSLVCTTRSCIPDVIGNRHLVKKLLLRRSETGELIDAEEDNSLLRKIASGATGGDSDGDGSSDNAEGAYGRLNVDDDDDELW